MTRGGRQYWHDWPEIISDNTLACLNFSSAERLSMAAQYRWPMVEGLANPVRVRVRRNAGVTETEALLPGLLHNDGKTRLSLGRLVQLAFWVVPHSGV